MCHQYCSHGGKKEKELRCFKLEACECSVFYFLIIVTKTTENQMQWEDNAETSLEMC